MMDDMATRIQEKSRVTKRPISTGTYDLFDDSYVVDSGKPPRSDPRGFPTYGGIPTNIVLVTVVDTTP